MNNTSKKSAGRRLADFLGTNTVPIMFIIICAVCIPICGVGGS